MKGLSALLAVVVLVLVACGPPSKAVTAPTTQSGAQEYPRVSSATLRAIASARDEWYRLSAERSQAIATLAQHLDPSKVRGAIAAEGEAMDRLYALVSDAVTTFEKMTPPKQCQKLHLITKEALKLEEQAFKEFKASYRSADLAKWEGGTRLLAEADKVKSQIDSQLGQCISGIMGRPDKRVQRAARLKVMAEINQTLAYLNRTEDYALRYAESMPAILKLQALEGGGDMREQATLAAFWLNQVTLLKGDFQSVPVPPQAQGFSTLMLEAMGATERSLTILSAIYSESAKFSSVTELSRDQQFLERFAESWDETFRLLKEGLSKLGKASDEKRRLLNDLEEWLKQLRQTK